MISWDMFNINNQNKTKSFEQLSRLLFRENYCVNNTILRSNPNHIGIEVDPVKNINGELISFQAKYFEGKIDYSQIKGSFENIANEYNGLLNKLYLYTNKDVSKKNKSYISSLEILKSANIECIEVTNEEILEQAGKSLCAVSLFFNEYKIDLDWFKNITTDSLNSLSKRFNKNFNAMTDTEKQIAIFCESNLSEKIFLNKVNKYLEKCQVQNLV